MHQLEGIVLGSIGESWGIIFARNLLKIHKTDLVGSHGTRWRNVTTSPKKSTTE